MQGNAAVATVSFASWDKKARSLCNGPDSVRLVTRARHRRAEINLKF